MEFLFAMLLNYYIGLLGKEENETPGWTQLKLPGQAPLPRCGHTVTSGGHYLVLFGGHGTGGWLSRYDIYHNDCVVLDRVSVQWKKLPTSNEPPPARAYHSMTCIASRYLLFGGFDGKTTFGDLWWLVPEEDPIANRLSTSPPRRNPENKDAAMSNDPLQSRIKESGTRESAISDLQKRLEVSLSPSRLEPPILEELEDKELIELASRLTGESVASKEPILHTEGIEAVRDHWRKSLPQSIQLKELSPLLRDYQRLIARHHIPKVGPNLQYAESDFHVKAAYRFYHLKNASQLRMDDIPKLLAEYKQLPSGKEKTRH